jgi:hypothetical protein
MKTVKILLTIIILFNIAIPAQVYKFINKQLILKSRYQPERFYLEQRDKSPYEWHYSRELALPDSQETSIVIINSHFDTVKIIYNDWLKKGLYDIQWNLTNEHGQEIGDDIYTIRVKTIGLTANYSDSTKIWVFGRKYNEPLILSNTYLNEFETDIQNYKYIGNGFIVKNEENNLKDYNIELRDIKLDTSTISTIEMNGFISLKGKPFNHIPFFDIIVTPDDINFEKAGQIDLQDGTLSNSIGWFRIFTTVFPNTKVFFLHKDYVIKCFRLGKLSSMYKDNPEMLKRYMDDDKKK